MKRAILDRIINARAARCPISLLTWLDGGRQELITSEKDSVADLALPDALGEHIATSLRSDQAGVFDVDGISIFVQPLNPPLRMVIVGAVHIGQHLAVMSESAGYDVTVVDPRTAFATAERFPGIKLNHDWPNQALSEIGLDTRTAVVTLTHDPKLDDPALIAALDSSAFYIGSLGSRRTQARRLSRLRDHGIDSASLERIHAPVGLDIGARSPAEIAISTLAQVTERLRRVS